LTAADFLRASDVDIDSFCSLTRDEISQTKNYYQNLLTLETFSGSELLAVISSHRNFIETGHEKMDELLCGGLRLGESFLISHNYSQRGEIDTILKALINVVMKNNNTFVFDARLSPSLNVSKLSNYKVFNCQVVEVTDLSDFELALAALRHKITTKQGMVYQDIRVIIINSIEKLVSSCECFDKKGFEILNGFLRRLNGFVRKNSIALVITVSRDELNKYFYETISKKCAREICLKSSFNPYAALGDTAQKTDDLMTLELKNACHEKFEF